MKTHIMLLAAALGFAPAAANATVVTKSFNLSASNFGAGAPTDPVTGTFSITYDKDALIIPATATGLTVTGFNLPYDGTAQYSYQKGGDFITISNAFTGLFQTTIGGAGQKFTFTIFDISTNPHVNAFGYSKDGSIYNSNSVSLTPAAAVPEPSTWALLLAGFGAVGYSLRRRDVRFVKRQAV